MFLLRKKWCHFTTSRRTIFLRPGDGILHEISKEEPQEKFVVSSEELGKKFVNFFDNDEKNNWEQLLTLVFCDKTVELFIPDENKGYFKYNDSDQINEFLGRPGIIIFEDK